MFYKEVNVKKRGEMITFLKKHFRYPTMNSWNRSTSYADRKSVVFGKSVYVGGGRII